MSKEKVGNVKSIKPFYAVKKKSYSKDPQIVKNSLVSFLWGEVTSDIMLEFLEVQDLGSCACRTNCCSPGVYDASHERMANDSINYENNTFKTYSREY